MPKIITEDMIEQAAIKAFENHEEYTSINCMTENAEDLNDNTGRTDKRQVVLPNVVSKSLCKINPDIPESTVRIIADELCRTPKSGDLMLTNFNNYQKIRNGITVEYEENGRKTSNKLKVVDFTTPEIPWGTIILCFIIEVSSTSPNTSPTATVSPIFAIGSNCHFLSWSILFTDIPRQILSPYSS